MNNILIRCLLNEGLKLSMMDNPLNTLKGYLNALIEGKLRDHRVIDDMNEFFIYIFKKHGNSHKKPSGFK